MTRSTKLAVLLLVAVACALAWRFAVRAPSGGFAGLTPVPGAVGFEPATRPSGPVLHSRTSDGLDVDFGYTVGAVAHDYTMALRFARGATDGTATMVARGDPATRVEAPAVRRWDEPRKSYAVAVTAPPSGRAMPALCIKVVIGPSLDTLDLADGTLCAAQRDGGGTCHPETLACGLLRPN